MATISELQGRIKERAAKIDAAYAEAKTDDPEVLDFAKVKAIKPDGTDREKLEEIERLNKLDVEDAATLALLAKAKPPERAASSNGQAHKHGDGQPQQPRTLAKGFVDAMYRDGKFSAQKGVDYSSQGLSAYEFLCDVRARQQAARSKTLFERTAGWEPETTRTGRVVLDEQAEPILIDSMPLVPMSQVAYVYMEETTFTSNADETAEGGTFGEAAFELTERSQTVEKIPTWIPVTDEQLADVAGIQAYLESRLELQLRQVLDGALVSGSGSTPQLLGVTNATGLQTQAKGADPTFDALHKALTLIRVNGRAEANAYWMHPNDWEAIRLTRTADGIYILGNPSEEGLARIWSKPVIQSTDVTENTAIAGAFRDHSLVGVYSDVEFAITDSHSDFFIKGKQAIRAQMRVVIVWLRGTAFCTITGI